MTKTSKKHKQNYFPPFEFGLDNYANDASIFGALYDMRAVQMEEFMDFLNISSNLIVKNAKKVYQDTLDAYAFHAKEEMPSEHEERLVRVMYWGTHERFIYELLFVRLVENFLIYLTDIVYGVLNSQGLSESEIEKQQWSLYNFKEVKRFFSKLGFPLFLSKKDETEVEKIIAIRNLLVHKSGIVDNRFSSRFPSLKSIKGIKVIEEGLAEVKLNQRVLIKYSKVLAKVVSKIDKRAIKRFQIITVEQMLERAG